MRESEPVDIDALYRRMGHAKRAVVATLRDEHQLRSALAKEREQVQARQEQIVQATAEGKVSLVEEAEASRVDSLRAVDTLEARLESQEAETLRLKSTLESIFAELASAMDRAKPWH